MLKLRLLAVGCLAALGAFVAPAHAAVINAKSGSSADIQAAVNRAKTGDTVAIPAGRFLFTGEVFAPDGIHIKGAGMNSTYLIKNDNLSTWQAMFVIDAKTGRPFQFSGITLQGRLDALQGSNRTTAVTSVTDQGLLIKGAAKNFQIYGSRFTKFIRAGIEFLADSGTVPGDQTGVIYQNQFIDNWYINLGYGVAVNGSASAWNKAITLGTSDAIFIEDNYFDLNRHCVAADNGANYVARYNTVQDNYQDAGAFDAHGLNPAWPRGTRTAEIYKNTVKDSIRRWAGVELRGGGGVVWGNTWTGVTYGAVLLLETPPSTLPLRTYKAKDQIGNPAPFYIWSNTTSGTLILLDPTTDALGINYWLKQNRDYYLSAKPGYVPYIYPHPLRAAASQ